MTRHGAAFHPTIIEDRQKRIPHLHTAPAGVHGIAIRGAAVRHLAAQVASEDLAAADSQAAVDFENTYKLLIFSSVNVKGSGFCAQRPFLV